jgi:hypothetical protein
MRTLHTLGTRADTNAGQVISYHFEIKEDDGTLDDLAAFKKYWTTLPVLKKLQPDQAHAPNAKQIVQHLDTILAIVDTTPGV